MLFYGFFIRYKKDMRMIKHNKEIIDILNDYLKIKKPGYAVLLKGPWGCGKTYFVKIGLKILKQRIMMTSNLLR